MIIALYIVAIFFLVHGAYQLGKYFIISSYIKNKFSKDLATGKVEKLNYIFILAPVLHEEKTIRKFLTDLLHQDYPKDKYSVCIISTEKEYIKPTFPNTIEIIDEIKKDLQFDELKILHLHYPEKSGYKAHQLNFAFSSLKKELGNEALKDSFFFSLDADSEVDRDTLLRLNSTIEDGIDVYQQPLLWFKNINAIKSSIMQSFSFTQSFFSISYEIPMFIGRFFPLRLKYFVGHGLCVRGSFLDKVGGYPSIIEDVRLGRLSSFLNTKVKLIPSFGVVETAKNISIYVKQSSIWFFGCGLFVSDYINAKKMKGGFITIRDLIMVLYGFFKAFRWLNKGLFHLVGIILSVLYLNTPLIILFVSSLLLNSSMPVLCVYFDFKTLIQEKIGNKNKVRMIVFRSIIFSAIIYMFNFIGLYYGLGKLLNYHIWGKIRLQKTER